MLLKQILSEIAELVFPNRCRICGLWNPSPICQSCEQDLSLSLIKTACRGCAHPYPKDLVDCVHCRSRRNYIDGAFALYRFEKGIRELIHSAKYSNDREVIKIMSAQIAAKLVQIAAIDDFTLCAVPMDGRKLRRRGYNQSALLAGYLAKYSGAVVFDGLIKCRLTADQNSLNRSERYKNIKNSFSCLTTAPSRVVLIDDVITTGATVNECARTLKKAGCREVIVLAVCRAVY